MKTQIEKIKTYLKENPLWEIVFMLVVSFGLITIYSFIDWNFKIPEIEIKKTEISQVFKNNSKKENNNSTKNLPASTDTVIVERIIKIDTLIKGKNIKIKYDTIFKYDTINKEEFMTRLDTTKQRIMIIGDSMLEYLRLRLRDYCQENNHQLKTVIWYSSTTEYFGKSDTLAYFIKEFDPTYIILVLGANELFVRDIKQKRQKYVEHILKQIGNRKFLWVGPPNWKDDTGINELIVENVGAKRYYPSLKLKFKRHKDGAHPLKTSAFAWMDSVADFISHKSMYPIVLNKPTKTSKNSTNTTMLQPLK
jgi:hypothetical protein